MVETPPIFLIENIPTKSVTVGGHVVGQMGRRVEQGVGRRGGWAEEREWQEEDMLQVRVGRHVSALIWKQRTQPPQPLHIKQRCARKAGFRPPAQSAFDRQKALGGHNGPALKRGRHHWNKGE